MLTKSECTKLIYDLIDIGRLKKDPKDEKRILVYLNDDSQVHSVTIESAAQDLSTNESAQILLQDVLKEEN